MVAAFLIPVWTFLSSVWKPVGAFWADLPQWLKIAVVAALGLALWTWYINDRAFNRGTAAQKLKDDVKIGILADDVETLSAAIADRNQRIDEDARQARKGKAAADRIVEDGLDDMAAARRREAARGAGPVFMNDAMREIFGAWP